MTDIAWFGFGRTKPPAWGARFRVSVAPQVRIHVQALRIPSTVAGFLLEQVTLPAGPLFRGAVATPAEFFSEVSTAPMLEYGIIGPDAPIVLDVVAPAKPRRPRMLYVSARSRKWRNCWYVQRVTKKNPRPKAPKLPDFTGGVYGRKV